jgi:hypothetical protein
MYDMFVGVGVCCVSVEDDWKSLVLVSLLQETDWRSERVGDGGKLFLEVSQCNERTSSFFFLLGYSSTLERERESRVAI